MSALFLDYVNDWSRVRNFYPQDYSLDSVVSFARQRPPLDSVHRETLCAAVAAQQKQWGGDPSSVEKLDAGAVAIISGQQPGRERVQRSGMPSFLRTEKLLCLLECAV